MITTLRWVLVALLAGHGLLHLLGVAQGFGWAAVAQLTQPIGVAAGVLWLLAAALVLSASALLALGAPTWWWALALAGAAVSQVAIATSWDDARAGTWVNLLLLVAAVLTFASAGPLSLHAEYAERARQALAVTDPSPALVTEADLTGLPSPLAAYVRHSGALGRPRVVSFRAAFHGRIRSDPGSAWMPFTGHQVNTYGPHPRRIFLMDATRSGLPVTVLHVFADSGASMRVRLLSLVSVVDASGPEMDRGETVTLFNDLVVMAPGAIVDAPAAWEAVDDAHVRGTFTHDGQNVSATLTFDARHDLVDFVSDDRSRASADGRTFTQERWSTPLAGHHQLSGHRLMAVGHGVWHAGGSREPFTYLDFHLDALSYDVGHDDAPPTDPPPAQGTTAPAVGTRAPGAGRRPGAP